MMPGRHRRPSRLRGLQHRWKQLPRLLRTHQTNKVRYARSRNLNMFAIFSAQLIPKLNRQFHLLNFTLPRVPVRSRLQRIIPQQHPGPDDSGSESDLPALTASSITESEAEPLGSEVSVEAAEHRGKSGAVKVAPPKSAKLQRKTRGSGSNFGVGKKPASPKAPHPPE
ncbi:uncharacterized protein LOC125941764 [Dermacentor silvarum]|uniref:uncharacterized protein LOC125941764 n=1 Tax=Dermacentor silvarum TaxID=543639 RepID=UPI002101912D|nr:uncharacterized protein LOC125941764 [Dermacentor silvarum]